MKLNKKQQGFTLIELVIVIIILGVLSVIATPKLLSLSSEAQASSLQGVAGAIASVNKLVHSQTQIIGIADKDDCSGDCNGHPNWDINIGHYFVNVSGTRLYVLKGYPLASGGFPIIEENYRAVMGLSEDEFIFDSGSKFSIIPMKFKNKVSEIKAGTFKCHIENSNSISDNLYLALTDNC
ncbi:prepilin-type N-terminal cleavage/methylation domain-containing protein [Shewanella woodyi]|uniref:prepilin-type N-terminal cleavage/methylation domain-containing protein n=1 Tax=Shewanella woodyi TaxID=60961 RepID=UPI0007F919B1|nr:prepilin-type N-terminal cleavage/methylation domain-containing protein [Shewanella woodyi]